MKEYISNSREETIEIAKEFAKKVKRGDIICLNGDLGAGKTAFTDGFAKGLGYAGYVSSPTFSLINEYNTDLPIYHFDVYRLENCDEADDIGIDDYLFGDGVCIIEWSENIKEILPENVWEINILKDETLGENVRKIIIKEKR